MELIYILAAALLPAILLLLYIWKTDPKPEPKSGLIKAVLLGIVIIFPVIFVEASIDNMLFGTGGRPSDLVYGRTRISMSISMVLYMLYVSVWDLQP